MRERERDKQMNARIENECALRLCKAFATFRYAILIIPSFYVHLGLSASATNVVQCAPLPLSKIAHILKYLTENSFYRLEVALLMFPMIPHHALLFIVCILLIMFECQSFFFSFIVFLIHLHKIK